MSFENLFSILTAPIDPLNMALKFEWCKLGIRSFAKGRHMQQRRQFKKKKQVTRIFSICAKIKSLLSVILDNRQLQWYHISLEQFICILACLQPHKQVFFYKAEYIEYRKCEIKLYWIQRLCWRSNDLKMFPLSWSSGYQSSDYQYSRTYFQSISCTTVALRKIHENINLEKCRQWHHCLKN